LLIRTNAGDALLPEKMGRFTQPLTAGSYTGSPGNNSTLG